MSTILNAAMAKLAVITNVATGLAHPLDESRAKELFMALHARGLAIDFSAVKRAALDNGWSERHADQIAELADKIHNGRRVVIEHPRDWGEPTVAELVAEHEGT